MIAVRLDQFSAGGEACELFEEKAAIATAAEAYFAHKLLIPGALTRGALDAAEQIAVILGKGLRPVRRLEMGARQRIWYRLRVPSSGKD